MSKTKYPRAIALAVAKELCAYLSPFTERLIVAGSLRRRKLEVGDVEILFVPKFEQRALDFFSKTTVSMADEMLSPLCQNGIIEKRPNVNGSTMWGEKNKFAVHVATGVPVDLFTATAENWFNYLVCRTGSAENNMAIATAAQARGWKWNPYGAGFTNPQTRETHLVTSEQSVYEFVGLPYKEPWERNS